MVSPHSQLSKVTQRVVERSKPTREAYLARIHEAQGRFPARGALSCANLAHGFAGLEGNDKLVIKQIREPNIGIVSSYNEMLSAHAPYKNYPDIIKQAARENGGGCESHHRRGADDAVRGPRVRANRSRVREVCGLRCGGGTGEGLGAADEPGRGAAESAASLDAKRRVEI